jgi:hypothetical protein
MYFLESWQDSLDWWSVHRKTPTYTSEYKDEKTWIYISTPRVGFEFTIAVFERPEIFRAVRLRDHIYRVFHLSQKRNFWTYIPSTTHRWFCFVVWLLWPFILNDAQNPSVSLGRCIWSLLAAPLFTLSYEPTDVSPETRSCVESHSDIMFRKCPPSWRPREKME